MKQRSVRLKGGSQGGKSPYILNYVGEKILHERAPNALSKSQFLKLPQKGSKGAHRRNRGKHFQVIFKGLLFPIL